MSRLRSGEAVDSVLEGDVVAVSLLAFLDKHSGWWKGKGEALLEGLPAFAQEGARRDRSWLAKPRKAISENGADVSSSNAGLDVRDPDMAAYRREHPEPWLGISNTGRRVLSTEMFGDAFAADEAFGV